MRPLLPASLRAAVWMIAGSIGFTLLWVLVRLAALRLHPFALLFWSNALGLLWLVPMLLTSRGTFRAGHMALHARRAGFGVPVLGATFYAVAHAPLALVLSIGFSAPVLAAFGTILFRPERPGWGRGAALIAGMAGLLILIRPEPQTFPAGLVAAMVAAAIAAGARMALGSRADDGNPQGAVVWLLLLMTPLSLLLALPWWSWPSGNLWPILFALGACAAAGQLGLAKALHLVGEGRALPFSFVHLALVAAAGSLLLREPLDAATLAGGTILLVASIVLARRARRPGDAG